MFYNNNWQAISTFFPNIDALPFSDRMVMLQLLRQQLDEEKNAVTEYCQGLETAESCFNFPYQPLNDNENSSLLFGAPEPIFQSSNKIPSSIRMEALLISSDCKERLDTLVGHVKRWIPKALVEFKQDLIALNEVDKLLTVVEQKNDRIREKNTTNAAAEKWLACHDLLTMINVVVRLQGWRVEVMQEGNKKEKVESCRIAFQGIKEDIVKEIEHLFELRQLLKENLERFKKFINLYKNSNRTTFQLVEPQVQFYEKMCGIFRKNIEKTENRLKQVEVAINEYNNSIDWLHKNFGKNLTEQWLKLNAAAGIVIEVNYKVRFVQQVNFCLKNIKFIPDEAEKKFIDQIEAVLKSASPYFQVNSLLHGITKGKEGAHFAQNVSKNLIKLKNQLAPILQDRYQYGELQKQIDLAACNNLVQNNM